MRRRGTTRAPGKSAPEFVYFIQSGDDGPVKIGRSANPKYRMGALQTANPNRLRLIGVIPGGEKVERGLHASLMRHRIGASEWFRPTREVKQLVYLMLLAQLVLDEKTDLRATPPAVIEMINRVDPATSTPDEIRAIGLAVLSTKHHFLLFQSVSDKPTHRERAIEVAERISRDGHDSLFDNDDMGAIAGGWADEYAPLPEPPAGASLVISDRIMGLVRDHQEGKQSAIDAGRAIAARGQKTA